MDSLWTWERRVSLLCLHAGFVGPGRSVSRGGVQSVCQIAWKHDPHFAPNRDPLRLKFERFQILRAVGLRAVGKWPAGASAESLAQAGHLSIASGPQVGRDGLSYGS